MDKKFTVYRATSSTTGKCYVGMTGTSLRQRINSHRFSSKKSANKKGCHAFYYAITKYGFDDFKFSVIKENLSKEEAQKLEFDLIEVEGLRAGKGYNSAMGGSWRDISENKNPMYGKHHSDESKRKIALANKGKDCKSIEGKMRIAEAVRKHHTGMKRSEEARKKMSASAMGRKASDGARANMSKARAGVKYSVERRAKQAPIARENGKKRSRPCTIDGIEYQSVSEASRVLGKSRKSIRRMEEKNGIAS